MPGPGEARVIRKFFGDRTVPLEGRLASEGDFVPPIMRPGVRGSPVVVAPQDLLGGPEKLLTMIDERIQRVEAHQAKREESLISTFTELQFQLDQARARALEDLAQERRHFHEEMSVLMDTIRAHAVFSNEWVRRGAFEDEINRLRDEIKVLTEANPPDLPPLPAEPAVSPGQPNPAAPQANSQFSPPLARPASTSSALERRYSPATPSAMSNRQ